VKRRMLTQANGIPIAIVVDGANRYDMKLVGPTIKEFKLDQPTPAPEHRHVLFPDIGYDDEVAPQCVARAGCTAHMRVRGEEALELANDEGCGSTLNRRAHAQFDEPISWPADPLAQ
jgi:putative transposase